MQPTKPPSAPRLAATEDARRLAGEARKSLSSILRAPVATTEQELLRGIEKTRGLPMHDDVRLLLDVIESYLRGRP
jgi:hypothetical protein